MVAALQVAARDLPSAEQSQLQVAMTGPLLLEAPLQVTLVRRQLAALRRSPGHDGQPAASHLWRGDGEVGLWRGDGIGEESRGSPLTSSKKRHAAALCRTAMNPKFIVLSDHG